MAKRLVICCDGTWDKPDEVLKDRVLSTNVAMLAQAVAARDEHGKRQLLYYNKGVGTGARDRLLGGAFGLGLSRHVQDCYRFLVEWYEPEDELFLFGFSRGAYTARSLAGFIRNCGILRRQNADELADAYELYRRRDDPSHPNAIESQLFRRSFSQESRIHFIGVWDTVGALGVPFPWLNVLNRRWKFHDVQLSSSVDNAFHALAIDEKRRLFRPTLWQPSAPASTQPSAPASNQPPAPARQQTLEQVWFAGVHRNVGGGEPDPGLSDTALLWMKEKAAACGLAFDEAWFAAHCTPNVSGKLSASRTGFYRLLPGFIRCLGARCKEKGTERGGATNEAAHATAVKRTETAMSPPYEPRNLADFLHAGGPVTGKD